MTPSGWKISHACRGEDRELRYGDGWATCVACGEWLQFSVVKTRESLAYGDSTRTSVARVASPGAHPGVTPIARATRATTTRDDDDAKLLPYKPHAFVRDVSWRNTVTICVCGKHALHSVHEPGWKRVPGFQSR